MIRISSLGCGGGVVSIFSDAVWPGSGSGIPSVVFIVSSFTGSGGVGPLLGGGRGVGVVRGSGGHWVLWFRSLWHELRCETSLGESLHLNTLPLVNWGPGKLSGKELQQMRARVISPYYGFTKTPHARARIL